MRSLDVAASHQGAVFAARQRRVHPSATDRVSYLPGRLHRDVLKNLLTPTAVAKAEASTHLPKGDMWSVHKFGGTCMGTSQRIRNVADIVLHDPSERKLVVVSTMSKVTDMMYNLINKAQSRGDSYIIALDEVFEKHMTTAKDLLEEDLARFLSELHADISNIKAMLRAIYIGSSY